MTWYVSVKILHVLAVITWMAGLLYLTMLFVYHTESKVDSDASSVFAVMERRLFRGIMTPAMIVAWLTGLWMAYDARFYHAGWFAVKFGFVVAMTAMHVFFGRERLSLLAGERRRTSRFYRIVNEVPAVFMVFIVAMVIAKPF